MRTHIFYNLVNLFITIVTFQSVFPITGVIRQHCIQLLKTVNCGLQKQWDSLSTDNLLKDVEGLANYDPNVLKKDALETFLVDLGWDRSQLTKLDNAELQKKVTEVAKYYRNIFGQPAESREGSEKDAEALSDTFTGFGYDVRTYNNLTAEQLRQTLKDLAKEKDSMGQSIFKRYASLVVCLLSHGSLGSVMGIDRQPVNVLELQYETFNSETCPDLNDKPKIFIIQACQGDIGQRMIPFDPAIDDVIRINVNFNLPPLNPGMVCLRL